MSNVRTPSSPDPSRVREIEFSEEEAEVFVAPNKTGAPRPEQVTQRNQLTAYVPRDGTAEQRESEQKPGSNAQPESGSGAVDHALGTAERALVRRSFDPFISDADVARVLATAEKLLVRTVSDPIVSERDVARMTEALKGLPYDEFQQALEHMEKRELLDVYFGNMEVPARREFIQVTLEKGVLSETDRRKFEGSGGPPDAPPLVANPEGMPWAVRNAIHAENALRVREYYDAYSDYRDRYVALVKEAPDAASLRALGPHVKPATFSEPGGEDVDVYRRSFSRMQMNLQPSQLPFAEAVADSVAQLQGKRRAGTLALDVSVGASLGPLQAETSAELRNDGSAQVHEKVGLKGHAVDNRLGDRSTTDAAVTTELVDGAQRRDSVEVSHAGTGVKLGSDGKLELQMKATPGLSSYAEVDNAKGVYGGGVAFNSGVIEAKVGVSFQGITTDDARRVIDGDGFFETPAELAAGKPWASLSASRRADVEFNGWTEAEWNRKLRGGQS